MESRVKGWSLVGFIVTCAVGTLLHFTYDLTGGNFLVGAVSAVNESVWEHMKILFWPMFLFMLAEGRAFGGYFRNFWGSCAAGVLTGVLLIPVVYYTYTGALGLRAVWVDITSFYVAAAAAWWVSCRRLNGERRAGGMGEWIALASLCLLALAFVWWTYAPPGLPLFEGP